MKQKTKKGFTLVELLVVIAILAILASVSVVGYLGFTNKAKASNVEQECKQAGTLIHGELLSNSIKVAVGEDADAKNYEVSLVNGDILIKNVSENNSDVTDTETQTAVLSAMLELPQFDELDGFNLSFDLTSTGSDLLKYTHTDYELTAQFNFSNQEVSIVE